METECLKPELDNLHQLINAPNSIQELLIVIQHSPEYFFYLMEHIPDHIESLLFSCPQTAIRIINELNLDSKRSMKVFRDEFRGRLHLFLFISGEMTALRRKGEPSQK
jgi:hypothetical protein